MIRIYRPACPKPSALDSRNYKDSENKNALRQASDDKCMYCESRISHVDFGQVEHIKPKSKYSELEFDWENLGYVCAKCNNKKSDSFDEDTPYVDPYSEDPKEHLYACGSVLFSKYGSERGEKTINDIELNRTNLLESRDERIQELQKAINACYRTSNTALRNSALRELKKESLPNKEYSLVVSAMLRSHNE
ncbi:MAG: HNH endonuclease [Alphaproteobacteria bacterium]|nr:HNH endonuclease [Alphaproteobacteria bacterium]